MLIGGFLLVKPVLNIIFNFTKIISVTNQTCHSLTNSDCEFSTYIIGFLSLLLQPIVLLSLLLIGVGFFLNRSKKK